MQISPFSMQKKRSLRHQFHKQAHRLHHLRNVKKLRVAGNQEKAASVQTSQTTFKTYRKYRSMEMEHIRWACLDWQQLSNRGLYLHRCSSTEATLHRLPTRAREYYRHASNFIPL